MLNERIKAGREDLLVSQSVNSRIHDGLVKWRIQWRVLFKGIPLRKWMNNESLHSLLSVALNHTQTVYFYSIFSSSSSSTHAHSALYVTWARSWHEMQRLKRGETWAREGIASNLCIVNVELYNRVCLHAVQIQTIHVHLSVIYCRYLSLPLSWAWALLMYEKAAYFHPVHSQKA